VFSNKPFLRFPKPVSRPRNNFSHPVGADDVVDADCYELNSGCYAAYGFEYKPGFVDDNAVCTLLPSPCVSEPLADAMLFLARSISPGSIITRVRGR
jgi:hypothetical protein